MCGLVFLPLIYVLNSDDITFEFFIRLISIFSVGNRLKLDKSLKCAALLKKFI